MLEHRHDLVELETRFWQSMVDDDPDTALSMLDEPALMVSSHGAMQFDHGQYRQMATQGSRMVKAFELRDMNVVFPNDDTAVLTYRVHQTLASRGGGDTLEQDMADASVWTRKGGQWRCVMHTETPVDRQAAH